MITATLQNDRLNSRLSAQAKKLALRKGQSITAAFQQSGPSWRSARALWPDLRLD